jgi:hypothetical protein
MTERHESEESPFIFSSESFSDSETVRDDGLSDIVVGQNDSLRVTC